MRRHEREIGWATIWLVLIYLLLVSSASRANIVALSQVQSGSLLMRLYIGNRLIEHVTRRDAAFRGVRAAQEGWPWADTWPVARLSAKSGDVELIILSGGSGRTLAFGPGHLSASVLPGERGNSVIAGHRDTHFSFLRDVEIGEILIVETITGVKHHYEVIGIDVVDSRRGSLVLDTDQSVLSLVTCYPFGAREAGGPMRFVVTARKQ